MIYLYKSKKQYNKKKKEETYSMQYTMTHLQISKEQNTGLREKATSIVQHSWDSKHSFIHSLI